MKKQFAQLTLAAVVVVAALLGGYVIGMRQADAQRMAEHGEEVTAGKATVSERQILYWYDPMRPDVQFDKPGKSPFMDMDLQPKYAEESVVSEVRAEAINIDARMVQRLGIRTMTIARGTFWQRIDTTGAVAFDESRVQVVEVRVNGWVRRLHANTTQAPVQAGQPLMTVYAPDLLAAQEELLIAKRSGDAILLDATRERLTLLGMMPAQIRSVLEKEKSVQEIVLVAPVSGVLTELNVREGAQVVPGTAVARISAMDRVWVTVEIPEAQAAWVRGKRPAEVRVPAFPDRVFEATVDYLYPQIDAGTRTLKARLAIANHDLALRPGMYAKVTLFGGPRHDVLLVPDEAVIQAGKQTLVFVAEGDGTFRPVAVTAGAQHNGQTVIEHGLDAGAKIVVSGQFLLESEANLQGALQRMAAPAASGDTP